MALLDIIQQNLATASSQPAGTTDQTGRARTLLAAKSGKQVGAGQLAPQSAVGEAAAVDQTNQGLSALQPQGQLAAAEVAQQQGAQQAQEQTARDDLALRQKQLQQRTELNRQQLFGEVARENRKLDSERDAAKLEQLGATLRLNDKKYVDTLALEGQRQRLDNEVQFKEALQKAVFGSNLDLFRDKLDNRDVLYANDRQFADALAKIDVNAALQMAGNEARDAQAAAKIGAATSLANTGIGAYGTYANSSKGTAAPTETAANTTSGVNGTGSATKYSGMA